LVGRVKATEVLRELERLECNSAIEVVVRHYGTEARLLVYRPPTHIEERIYVVFGFVPSTIELGVRVPVLWKSVSDRKGFWVLKEAFTADRLADFVKWLSGNLHARLEDLEVEVVSWARRR